MTEIYRPYAPPDVFLQMLEETMHPGIPKQITSKSIMDGTGHSQVTSSRLLAALRFFSLIDSSGASTARLEGLAKLDDRAFGDSLREIIQESYQDIFEKADPAFSTKEQIEQAFRPYTPSSQRYRMVVFFLGLCRRAGVDVFTPKRTRQLALENRNNRTSGFSSSAAKALAPSESIIRGMIEWLPKEGTPLSPERKDHWTKTMRNILDVIYPEEE